MEAEPAEWIKTEAERKQKLNRSRVQPERKWNAIGAQHWDLDKLTNCLAADYFITEYFFSFNVFSDSGKVMHHSSIGNEIKLQVTAFECSYIM